MSQAQALLKTSVVSTFSRFVGVGLNYAVVLLLTNTLSTHVSGIVLLLMVLVPTAALLSRLGVEQWLVRDVARLADGDTGQQAAHLHSAYALVGIGTATMMLLWWAGIPWLQHYLFDDALPTLPLVLAAVGVAAFNVIMLHAAFLKAVRHTAASLLVQNSLPALSFLLLLGLFWQRVTQGQTALWLYSASLVLAGFAALLWLRPWWGTLFTGKNAQWNLRAVWQQSLPLAPVSILAFLLLWVDTLMVGWLLGNHDVALYNVAARLSFISLFFLGALDAAIYPRLLQAQQRQPQQWGRLFWQATVLVAGLLGAVTVALGLLGETLLGWFGADYQAASGVLVWLAVAQWVRALSLTFSFLFIMQDKVRYLNALLLLSLLLAVLGNLLWVPTHGLQGAAWAMLLANGVLSGGVILLAWRLRLLPAWGKTA